jgi:hypothetical protein
MFIVCGFTLIDVDGIIGEVTFSVFSQYSPENPESHSHSKLDNFVTKSHTTLATETTPKSHTTLATETTPKSHTTLATETTSFLYFHNILQRIPNHIRIQN